MKARNCFRSIFVLSIVLLLVLPNACSKVDKDKIPITTSSKQARKYFLEGRDLFERLQAQESRQYFERAMAEDSTFAMACLFLANTQPTERGFFEYLNKAVALAENASEAESLWILGTQAGVYAMPMKQRELYQKLVELYPRDERGLTLLGNNFFAQQEWQAAIDLYNQAVEINPEFSQPYNQLGYAHRFLGNYGEAEKAFQKYIELIPDDPNPYDSYAELLLKMGRFDESIENYRKALECNPNFVASHVGMATNFNLKGEHQSARKQLQTLLEMARNDGERRAAHFAMTVSYIDEGNIEEALKEQEKQYALAEKINDATAMATDLITMGDIHLEASRPAQALAIYDKAVQVVEASDRSQEIKDNSRRGFLFNSARVAVQKGDLKDASAIAAKFLQAAAALNNPFQIRLAHQLMGMIALAQKDYHTALTELQQADQQDPYNLYRMALALQGKGESEQAREYFGRAANFNSLNDLQYAFIRAKAWQMVELL